MNPNTPENSTPYQHGASAQAYSGRPPANPAQPDKLIRIKTVCELTALGKTSIYSLSDFPKRVVLSRRAVAWRMSEVLQWMQSRVQAGGQ